MATRPTLRKGDRNSDVKYMQERLKLHGRDVSLDGIFGTATEASVKYFQKYNGLTSDGVVGEKTWQKLLSGPNPTLRLGDKNHSVVLLQQKLKEHGRKVNINGVFDLPTQASVKYFQTQKKLTSDGVVGPNTWKALNSAPTAAPVPKPAVNYLAEARIILNAMGWRVNTSTRLIQAIKDFQRMWNLGPALKVDGVVGPGTYAALQLSKARRAKGQGDISLNFSAVEFRCKCGGIYSNCRRIWAHRNLVRACEAYRKRTGSFSPISACRCPSHNAKVGGYKYSQHIYGCAVDVYPEISAASMKLLGVASGIGIQRATGKVRHFDLRHLSEKNYPYATLSRVHTYYYG